MPMGISKLGPTNLLVGGLVAFLACLPGADAWSADKTVTIGTGSRAGVYFQVGRAICRLINRSQAEHGIACDAPASAGSIANLKAVREGSLQLAVAQSDWQYHAVHGTSRFAAAKADPDLRSVFSVHGEPFTLVVRRDAAISHLRDIQGKRVNIGNPGSGQRGTMEVVMRAMGWDKSSFSLANELPASQQSLALCHDQVQAMVYTVGHPNDSVAQAVRLCDAVIAEVSVKATLVTSAKVDAETIYAITKTVFEDLDSFRRMHPAFAKLQPERMVRDGLSAPLHEGAARYFKERGWN